MQIFKGNKLLQLLIPLMALLILSQTSNARIKREKRHYKNPWSLQVAVDNRFGNDQYHGLRFSFSRHYSRYNAVRFNLGLVEDRTYSNDNDIFNSHGIAFHDYNHGVSDVNGINLSVQNLFYPAFNRGFNLFWGIGPRLSIVETGPDMVLIYDYDFPFSWTEEIYSNKFTVLGLGVEGTVGMELFLGDNISLLAEYGFTLQNEWYLFDMDYYDIYGHHIDDVEVFDDGLHFDGSQFKLGLAMYF